jgi:hypothetical protein
MKFTLISCRFIYIFLLSCFFCLSSCSSYDRNEYQIVIDVKEFEVKHSQDLFDRKPETFLRVSTETESKDSDVYHEYKVNFVEKGETESFALDGVALDHKIKFSVDLYDFDVLAIIFPGDSEQKIGGTDVEIKIPTSITQSEITVDNDEVHLVFTYSIISIDE